MGFYEDPEKLTFDRAEALVTEYLDEYGSRITHVTCKEVARKFDVEESHHNLVRLNSALADELKVSRPSGAKATQYKVDNEN